METSTGRCETFDLKVVLPRAISCRASVIVVLYDVFYWLCCFDEQRNCSTTAVNPSNLKNTIITLEVGSSCHSSCWRINKNKSAIDKYRQLMWDYIERPKHKHIHAHTQRHSAQTAGMHVDLQLLNNMNTLSKGLCFTLLYCNPQNSITIINWPGRDAPGASIFPRSAHQGAR